MTDTDIDFEKSLHPFADLLGFKITECANGKSIALLPYHTKLLNPNKVLHGGVAYSLADSGMGAAVFSLLGKGERCATIEIKMSYLLPSGPHEMRCESIVLKKGRTVAMVESDIYSNGQLTAKASGTFTIFKSRQAETTHRA